MQTVKEWKRAAAEKAVIMDHVGDGVYSFTKVLIDMGDGHVATGAGFCKVRPGDVWKDNVALDKSRGRAIGNAIKALEEQVARHESL